MRYSFGGHKKNLTKQDGNGSHFGRLSLVLICSRMVHSQNGANYKTINRRCDRELVMYSLEKLKFCEARSMVFKHTHNVCMAPKGLHQVHEQKSYREAEGTQHRTLFKAVQS